MVRQGNMVALLVYVGHLILVSEGWTDNQKADLAKGR